MSAPTITLYGIANCDTVRKAKKHLDKLGAIYNFQDIREQPLQIEQLQAWSQKVGWTSLFNKRSTTYRTLDDAVKNNLTEQSALPLILEYPTLMKRPVLQQGEHVLVGFKENEYQALVGA